jgi:hypothetical protein
MTNELPPMEHAFTLNVIGEETRKLYKGDFVYKRPTIGAKSKIAATKVILNNREKVDEDTDFANYMRAYLTHTIIKAPDWWYKELMGESMYDINVLTDMYMEVTKFEKEWFDKVWKEEEKEA